MKLGVAGALGQPLPELRAATAAMARQLIGTHVTSSSTALFSAPLSHVVLGSAIRQSEPTECVEPHHDICEVDGSVIVLSGTITNLDQVSVKMLGEPWRHGDPIERSILAMYMQHGPEFVAELDGG